MEICFRIILSALNCSLAFWDSGAAVASTVFFFLLLFFYLHLKTFIFGDCKDFSETFVKFLSLMTKANLTR